jgi:hypothetical protein
MSTRMVWGLLVGLALLTAINVLANVFASGQQGVPSLDTEQGIRNVCTGTGPSPRRSWPHRSAIESSWQSS